MSMPLETQPTPPIKDGGHAALQADAVGAMIAFSAGIDIQPRLLRSCKSAAFWYAPSSPTPDTLGEAHQADLDDDACTDITTHDPAAILRLAEDAGIDLVKLTAELEREGVGAFRRSYHELLACIECPASRNPHVLARLNWCADGFWGWCVGLAR
jgi:hypothetical protein